MNKTALCLLISQSPSIPPSHHRKPFRNMVLTNFSGTGVGFGFGIGCGFGVGWGFGGMPLQTLGLGVGGGCGVGLGLGWGFGSAFGSHYRTTEVRFQGIEFEKQQNEVKVENEIHDGSAS